MSTLSCIEVPVLVVGAGPTGLVASLLLSHHGVESLTVERHPGTSIYPRATGINARTMEILRSLGLESEVQNSAFAVVRRPGRSRVLVDPLQDEPLAETRAEWSDVSPSRWLSCSQDVLEPILRRAATARATGEVRFGTELAEFREDEHGILAHLVDRASGEVTRVCCQYLIAADGARSLVRAQLGIGMQGPGELGKNISIHFRAPLRQMLARDPHFINFVANDEVMGIFVPTDGPSRWMFVLPASEPDDPPRTGFSYEQAAELVRKGAGVPDLDVDILGVMDWTMQADWAERMQKGRVFLAGDAAHRMTPAGGRGLNTGVQDVHNLCWKIGAVVHGWADPALLDTYEAERMPVSQFNTLRSMDLMIGKVEEDEQATRQTDLGFVYHSAAVIGDGETHAEFGGARAGGRAPHAWTGEPSARRSLLDLFGHGFVLLTCELDRHWSAAARNIAWNAGIPLSACTPANSDWRTRYGIRPGGAVLVRPDGHIAWLKHESCANPAAELSSVVHTIVGRTSTPLSLLAA